MAGQRFPNNQVPRDLWSSNGAAFVQGMAAPTHGGLGNNFRQEIGSPSNDRKETVKIDYNLDSIKSHLAVALRQHRERSLLSDRNGRVPLLPAWLTPGFAKLNSSQLLAYFRERQNPRFFNGFYLSSESLGEFQRECFANETDQLLKIAEGILAHSSYHEFGDKRYAEVATGSGYRFHRPCPKPDSTPSANSRARAFPST